MAPSPRLLRGSALCLQLRQGNTVELPEEENTPEKRVDRIFAMMDKVRRRKGPRPGQAVPLVLGIGSGRSTHSQ